MRRSNRARSGKKRNRSSSKTNKRVQVPKTKKVANLAWDDADVTSEEETDPKVGLNSPFINKLCVLFTHGVGILVKAYIKLRGFEFVSFAGESAIPFIIIETLLLYRVPQQKWAQIRASWLKTRKQSHKSVSGLRKTSSASSKPKLALTTKTPTRMRRKARIILPLLTGPRPKFQSHLCHATLFIECSNYRHVNPDPMPAAEEQEDSFFKTTTTGDSTATNTTQVLGNMI